MNDATRPGGAGAPVRVVVIDSNILYSSQQFRKGTGWQELLLYAGKHCSAVQFAVPEVVVQERANQECQRIAKQHQGRLKALRDAKWKLASAGIDTAALPAEEDVAIRVPSRAEVAQAMREDLTAAGVRVLSVPNADHDELVSWSLEQHPPFDATDKGYRDALIWHTVREIAAAQPAGSRILFVGADNDYLEPSAECGKDAPRPLHSKLVADLAQITTTTVTVVPTLQSADEILPEPDIQPDDDEDLDRVVRDRLARDSALLNAALVAECDQLIGEEIGSPDDRPGGLVTHSVPDVENLTIIEVSPVLETFSTDAHERFEGDTIVGDLSVAAEIGYDGYVHKADLYGPRGNWTVVDPDWNNHYANVEGVLNAQLVFRFVLAEDLDLTLVAIDIVDD